MVNSDIRGQFKERQGWLSLTTVQWLIYEDTKFALSRIICENVFEDQEIVSSRTRQSYNFEDCKNPRNPQYFVSLKVSYTTVFYLYVATYITDHDINFTQ